jgi:Rv2525c-like, glycoside hydrolase-like domain
MVQLSARMTRWGVIAAAAVTACTLSSSAALAAGSEDAQGASKTVTYLGYNFAVPASWPVIHVTPTTCVRFDRHAVYLGAPGSNQDCPTGLLGTTEAILMQPAGGPVAAASAAEDPIAHRITAVSHRIEVTATYRTAPGLITGILTSASLPAPTVNRSTGGRVIATPASTANAALKLAEPAAAAADVPASATSFTGEGFDACAAPSAGYMSAWHSKSPYGAVGIYIGGAERACAQPNLTAAWVARQAAAGWRFMPIYVGPQAEFDQITTPASQAVAAAEDAVTQAAALGLGTGTAIYYDMEAYPAAQKKNALAFMSAWTTQLHAEGYKSGIYSSSSSGVTDLVANFTKDAMPDVIWDALWNGDANTTDPAIPATDWADNDRAHQFNGGSNETYGGDTIDVDQDYLDVSLTPPGPVNPGQSALVTSAGTVADFVIRNGNLNTFYQASPGGRFTGPKKLTSGRNLAGTPVAVQAADGIISIYAETTKHAIVALRESAPGGAVTSTNLGGKISGDLAAIATQRGTVAVYAVGTNRDLYTYYQTGAGSGFKGPKKLTSGGNLTGTPAVVQAANGIISVYTRTTGGAIRAVWQNAAGGAVTKTRNLGGHVAGSPAAIVTARDTIAVYAVGTNKHLYGYQQSKRGGTFRGPTKLTSKGGLTGTPVSIPNANGTVSVYVRTTGGSIRGKAQSTAGGAFTKSSSLGGHIANDLAGVVFSDGAMALYANGTNGRQYGDQDASGASFAGWKVL